MRFEITPITLKNGETVTSLYHSPFDLNLFHVILLARTGLKLRVVLDDIDNIGIDRSGGTSGYAFQEKYFLSKTERTNIRALSLIMPKNLMANLSCPSLRELDKRIGIQKLKNGLGYIDSVEHWIRNITRQYGSYSIVGPDRAFAFMQADNSFIEAINDAKAHILNLLKGINGGNKNASEFVEWLLEVEPALTPTVSDYYHNVLIKLIKRFGLEKEVHVERMSDSQIQNGNLKTMQIFSGDESMRALYTKAVLMDGKKEITDAPFYSISKEDGQRLLPVENYIAEPSKYLIAPKVFMLNNFQNLILPHHAINNPHIHAREVMYSHKDMNCNQIFCEDNWLEWIASLGFQMNLNEIESHLYKRSKINFAELQSLEDKTLGSPSSQKEYEKWIHSASIEAIRRFKYPILFLALLGDKIFYENHPTFCKLTIK